MPDANPPAAPPRQPPAPIPGAAAVFALATLLTVVIAWPVVRAPTEMIYGREIAGRHYDAYTVIEQFGNGLPATGLSEQPVTDRLPAGCSRECYPPLRPTTSSCC